MRRTLFFLTIALATVAAPLSEDSKIQHALDRMTFGARPGDLDQVRAMGLSKWIDLQLHPDRMPENPGLEQKLQPLESLRMSTADLVINYPRPVKKASTQAPQSNQRAIVQDLVNGKLYRAIYSNRQLAEVLADFWYNHFNVYQRKGPERFLVTAYERDVIRPRVLGRFKDLLLATAQSPAMLVYLDNFQS